MENDQKLVEDVCDCDKRCPKCGKRKMLPYLPGSTAYPPPYYPQPTWPNTWITWEELDSSGSDLVYYSPSEYQCLKAAYKKG